MFLGAWTTKSEGILLFLVNCYKEKGLKRLFQQKPPKLESGGSADRLETNFFKFPIQKYDSSQFFSSWRPILTKIFVFLCKGVKIGQNWRKKFLSTKSPKLIRFAWNSFLRSKTMSAMWFRLLFDQKMFWETFRLKGVFGHFLTQSQISPIYRNAQRSHVWFPIRLICVYYKQK